MPERIELILESKPENAPLIIQGCGYIHEFGIQICEDRGRDRFYPWHIIKTALRIRETKPSE